MFNYLSLYQWAFKSFNISEDTSIVRKLVSENVRFAMVVKRSWIYAAFISWRFVLIAGIAVLNAYLLFEKFWAGTEAYAVASILLWSVGYWALSYVSYVRQYRRIYGSRPRIASTASSIIQMEEGDDAYRKFFNRSVNNYVVFFGVAAYVTGALFFGETGNVWASVINVFLLVVQILLSKNLSKKVSDLEMDFNVIVPGKIHFFNQSGIHSSNQTMNSNKIKTINTSTSGVLGSFFHYGTLTVLAEGDAAQTGSMTMNFVGHPNETTMEINKLLAKELEEIEESENYFLSYVLSAMKEKSFDAEKVSKWLSENESVVKERFEKGSDHEKEEIREAYRMVAVPKTVSVS